ncbi:hypothetical protein [Parasphingorhabdus sp.]|uniref:hypothetical protein n=1 Tax=Parasphingorhabdus sp. TaxID=2709688 RepID=UPI0035940325
MIATLVLFVAVQTLDHQKINVLNPGLYQQKMNACKAQVGENRAEADIAESIIACLEKDPELMAAQKACSKKHKNDDAAVAKCLGIVDATNMPLEELKSDISNRHPVDYYMLAARLFQAEQKDAAVFWFYAGQLRWRARLSCFGSDPGGESALFGAMNQQVGLSINEYVGGYPSKWVETIHRVVEWDKSDASEFQDRQECQSHIHKQREGLLGLAKSIERDREKIALQRTDNDLPNFEQ